MTVLDLRRLLRQFPPEAMVCVRGYEANYNEVGAATTTIMALDVDAGGMYGKHSPIGDEPDPDSIGHGSCSFSDYGVKDHPRDCDVLKNHKRRICVVLHQKEE